MTQTLMDFMALVSPPPPAPQVASAADPAELGPLEQAEQHFQARLDRLNRKIGRLAPGGRLVGVPLCPSACQPGDLADFVLALGTDPFRRWNMVLYADGPATARTLSTVPYHPDYDHAVDGIMVDYLTRLRRTRDHGLRRRPGASAEDRAAMDQTLRDRLFADCAKIESTLFDERERQWRLQSDGAIPAGSPPSAVIRSKISLGSGAENRIC